MRYRHEPEVERVVDVVRYLTAMGVPSRTDDDGGDLYVDMRTALDVMAYRQPDSGVLTPLSRFSSIDRM